MDDDGTPYLSFVRFNDGNNVWIAELEKKDLITLKKETMRLLYSCFTGLGGSVASSQ